MIYLSLLGVWNLQQLDSLSNELLKHPNPPIFHYDAIKRKYFPR